MIALDENTYIDPGMIVYFRRQGPAIEILFDEKQAPTEFRPVDIEVAIKRLRDHFEPRPATTHVPGQWWLGSST